VAELTEVINAARSGWYLEGLGRPSEPLPRLAGAVPLAFDWAQAKPLSALDRIIEDLLERRSAVLAQVPSEDATTLQI